MQIPRITREKQYYMYFCYKLYATFLLKKVKYNLQTSINPVKYHFFYFFYIIAAKFRNQDTYAKF